jgi:hypothetical protein
MTADFETWLDQVARRDELEPGVRPAGAERLLREIFDRRGPISVQELRAEGQEIQMGLAQAAVSLVLRDLHATTKARPNVELRHDEEYGLVVTYNGGWTTPATMSMQNPEATCEIADYLQGEIVADREVWTAWPTCPRHGNGLYAQVHEDAAVWHCRTGSHRVAAIGQLTS